MFLAQDEQAVSDLRRGRAVWDGERSLAEETFTVGKVRPILVFYTKQGLDVSLKYSHPCLFSVLVSYGVSLFVSDGR